MSVVNAFRIANDPLSSEKGFITFIIHCQDYCVNYAILNKPLCAVHIVVTNIVSLYIRCTYMIY